MGLGQSKARELLTTGYLLVEGGDQATVRDALNSLRLCVSGDMPIVTHPDGPVPDFAQAAFSRVFGEMVSIGSRYLTAIDAETRILTSFHRVGDPLDTLTVSAAGNLKPRADAGLIALTMADDTGLQVFDTRKSQWIDVPPYTLLVTTGKWLQGVLTAALPGIIETRFGFEVRGNRDLKIASSLRRVTDAPTDLCVIECQLGPNASSTVAGKEYAEVVGKNRLG